MLDEITMRNSAAVATSLPDDVSIGMKNDQTGNLSVPRP
jgi:hypothetical protein